MLINSDRINKTDGEVDSIFDDVPNIGDSEKKILKITDRPVGEHTLGDNEDLPQSFACYCNPIIVNKKQSFLVSIINFFKK